MKIRWQYCIHPLSYTPGDLMMWTPISLLVQVGNQSLLFTFYNDILRSNADAESGEATVQDDFGIVDAKFGYGGV